MISYNSPYVKLPGSKWVVAVLTLLSFSFQVTQNLHDGFPGRGAIIADIMSRIAIAM